MLRSDPTNKESLGEELREARARINELEAALGNAEDRRAEEELVRTRNLLAQTSRMARVGGWEKNLPTGEDTWSEMTREIHEVGPDYVPSMESGIEFYQEGESRDTITRVVTRAIETGEPFDVELQIVTAKGNLRWVRALGNTEFEDGKCVRLYGTFQDIDDWKRVQGELRRNEGRLKAITENLGSTIIQSDRAGRIIFINHVMPGLSRSQVLASTVFDFVPPEQHPVVERALEAAFCHGETSTYESLGPGPDGQSRTYYVTVSPIFSEGEVISAVFLASDITERKQAERQTLESQQRLQTLFASSPDFFLLLDTEHRVRLINRTEDGLDQESVIGMPLFQLAAADEQARVKDLLDRVVLNAEKQQYNTVFERPDGSKVHFSSIAAPVVVDGQVTGTVISSRDITDRLRLENEKERLEEQFHQSQKMEAIGRLAGGVAHDFNNVLCAIIGNTELALADLTSANPLREPITEIAAAASRASDLTQQLLAFSRRQVIEPRVIDLSQQIEKLHPMLTRLIGEHIVLRTVAQPCAGRVRVDPAQIDQVVLNLAVNARDAMPDGGELLIETTDIRLDEAHPHQTPGTYVMLTVSDTGGGMDEETREKIFEPFFTTKQLGQGTGLGLATVFGIVSQNDGRIEVCSEPGQGTTFRVYFPHCPDPAEPVAPSQTPAPTGGGETVLLVEDEEIVRNLGVKLLRRLGYHVLATGSGGEALILAEKHEGPIDLLLTDVVMPIMNGDELADRLSEAQPGIKVLFMSGYPQDVIAHHGVLYEGVRFMPKPFTIDTLAAKVREVLDDPGLQGSSSRRS